MAHYVTKPNQKSLKYYIFSTVVMGPISRKMYRAEMERYLAEQSYNCYLDPRPWTEQNPEWYDGDSIWAQKLREDADNLTYWNGSFWYVTEEDNCFV